jgi:hypothetical protein
MDVLPNKQEALNSNPNTHLSRTQVFKEVSNA